MARRTRLIIAIVIANVVFYVVSVAVRPLEFWRPFWSDLWWTAASGLAGWKCLHTASRQPERHKRISWRWFGAGCLAWFVGIVIWDVYELVLDVPSPYPSVGEIGFIGLVPLFVVGFIYYKANAPSTNLTMKQVGDLGVIATMCVMVSAIMLYAPAAELDETPLYFVATLGYPVAHLTGLLFGFVCLWQYVWGRNRWVMTLHLLGVAMLAFVTTIYSLQQLQQSYATGYPLDVLWITSFSLIIWAAYEEDWISEGEAPTGWVEQVSEMDAFVPVAALLAVVGSLIIWRDQWRPELAPIYAVGAPLFVLSFGLREWSSVRVERALRRELQQLNIDLERRVRKRTEQLATARDQAEAANHAKSEFLAAMSHEIRTPLHGLLGMAQLLRETDVTDEQENYVGIVQRSGEALLAIINDVLDISKIEAGKLEIERIAYSPTEVVENALEMMAGRAHVQDLEINGWIDPRVPDNCWGDPNRLRQVLLNLIGNAVRFTKRGEIICHVEPDDIEGRVRFEVRDTGIGIEKGVQEHLFDAFKQADSSTTRQYGGTGLGLAIARQLVHLMGGEIGVESQVGMGSTFWFTIDAEPARGYSSTTYDMVRLKGKPILHVDSNLTRSKYVRTVLELAGARVTRVRTGADAIEEIRHPSLEWLLVLFDVDDPTMPGLELCEKLRQEGAPPLIAITSTTQHTPEQATAKFGVAAHVFKPIRRERLLLVARRVLGAAEALPIDPSDSVLLARRQEFRLLLVDDNRVNRVVGLKMLEKLGYDADAAGDGVEAVEAIETGKYDLVLMDCHMPNMDGFEAAARIRSMAGRRGATPIIAMTASATTEARRKCLEVGMNSYLSKPMRREQLAEMLDHYLLDHPITEPG